MDIGPCGWRGNTVAAVLVLVAALALSSCARPVPTTTVSAAGATATTAGASDWDPSKLPDPCRLLTTQEVAAQFGHRVSRARRVNGWPPFCQFVLDDATGQVLLVADDSRADAKANFQQRKALGSPLAPVTGVGDDAYWLPQDATLHALSGSTRVYLALRSDTDPSPAVRKHLVALARLAIRRALRRSSAHP